MRMVYENPSQNYLKFIQHNSDLRVDTPLGRIYFFERSDGVLSIHLELDISAGQDKLIESAPTLFNWRDRLIRWQGGTDQEREQLAFIENLLVLKERMSYSKLAQKFNSDIYRHLLDRFAFHKVVEKFSKDFTTWDDYQYWLMHEYYELDSEGLSEDENKIRAQWYDGLSNAEKIMRYIRIHEEDIRRYVVDILEDFENDSLIFSPDFPITPLKVRETIRYWGKKLRESNKLEKDLYDGIQAEESKDWMVNAFGNTDHIWRKYWLRKWNDEYLRNPYFYDK